MQKLRTWLDIGKKKYFMLILLVIVGTALIGGGMVSYNQSLNEDLSHMACDAMGNQLEQQRYYLQSKLEADMRAMEDVARLLCYVEKEPQELRKVAAEMMTGTSFAVVAVVDEQGKGFTSTGADVDLSAQPYFLQAQQGNTSVALSTGEEIPQTGKIVHQQIVMASPITVARSANQILVGAYPVEQLETNILPAYQGVNAVYFTDSSGRVIVGRDATLEQDVVYRAGGHPRTVNNIFDALKNTQIKEYDTPQQMAENMLQAQSGHAVFFAGGERQLLHYVPLGVSDWYVTLSVPEASVTQRAQNIVWRTAALSLLIFGLVALLAWYIIWLRRKAGRENEAYLRKLEVMAYCDALTGLPNLFGFKRLMEEMLRTCAHSQFSLTKFGVVNFKAVNQMFGFEMGNQVIQAMRDAVAQVQRERELVHLLCARVNGDEFLLLDECGDDPHEITKRHEHFEAVFRQLVRRMLGDYKIELRYGRYYLAPDETDVEAAVEKANLAHHAAKASETRKVCEYEEVMKEKLFVQLAIEHRMEAALQAGDFKVFLQPKYALRTECVVGAEALVRWQQEDGSFLSPSAFIPLFERNGFVVQLDMYMFEQVCAIVQGWMKENKPAVPISVNFSRLHLNNPEFVSQLEMIADAYEVPRRFLEIELTESVFFQNERALQELLTALHGAGFLLSMDDFGTGYSSLGLLKDLPVDIIKIDRSFFASESDARARLVIESVLQMAKKLGIHTVAEGVETKAHIDFLRQVDCDMVQGFYYARPVAAEAFFDADKPKAP